MLTHVDRYRDIPTFGRDTIRKFVKNVSGMSKLAARDFEDLLQVYQSFAVTFTVCLWLYSAQFPFLMDCLNPATMHSSWTSYLSSPRGMPLPSFVFTPNPQFALSKPRRLDWVLHCKNSSQQFAQNLRLETYRVRKQLEDDGRQPRQRQRHQSL